MDTLIDRIEQGMATIDDARIVARMIGRLAAYELALREIALYGTGDMATLACRALAGEEVEAWTPADAN